MLTAWAGQNNELFEYLNYYDSYNYKVCNQPWSMYCTDSAYRAPPVVVDDACIPKAKDYSGVSGLMSRPFRLGQDERCVGLTNWGVRNSPHLLDCYHYPGQEWVAIFADESRGKVSFRLPDDSHR